MLEIGVIEQTPSSLERYLVVYSVCLSVCLSVICLIVLSDVIMTNNKRVYCADDRRKARGRCCTAENGTLLVSSDDLVTQV